MALEEVTGWNFSDRLTEWRDWAQSDHPRVHTGFPVLDSRANGGPALGELVMFTARSQVGKTWWACNVVANARVPTVYFSLEMHGRYIAMRLASVITDTDTRVLEESVATNGWHPALDDALAQLPRIAIVDTPGMSFRQMSDALEAVKDEWGERPLLAVVDFLELIGGNPALEQVTAVDKLAQKAKDFAREHDLVLVVLHQVSRGAGAEGHLPLSITSGRYGGEHSADYVLGAYRPALDPVFGMPGRIREYRKKLPEFWLQLLKTRGGAETYPSGVRYRINPSSGRMSLWDDDDAIPTPSERSLYEP